MGKLSARDRTKIERLEDLYQRIPAIECRRLCSIACGSIPLTDLEALRLHREGKRKPKTIPIIPEHHAPIEKCNYLHGTHCTVYDARPLICRVWGVVKMLSCMHGCVPERWLETDEFFDLAVEIERLGGGRVLRTTPEGLLHEPGESYQAITAQATAGGARQRSKEAMRADAERTRNLRAIYGGRILAAVQDEP